MALHQLQVENGFRGESFSLQEMKKQKWIISRMAPIFRIQILDHELIYKNIFPP